MYLSSSLLISNRAELAAVLVDESILPVDCCLLSYGNFGVISQRKLLGFRVCTFLGFRVCRFLVQYFHGEAQERSKISRNWFAIKTCYFCQIQVPIVELCFYHFSEHMNEILARGA